MTATPFRVEVYRNQARCSTSSGDWNESPQAGFQPAEAGDKDRQRYVTPAVFAAGGQCPNSSLGLERIPGRSKLSESNLFAKSIAEVPEMTVRSLTA